MSIRLVYVSLLVLTSGWLVPGALVGQDAPAPQAPDSVALAFEREVFTYPQYDRRNPFKTLLSGDGGGPRFESLLLLGILYSPFAGESIALFGEGTRTVNSVSPGAPQTVTVEITGGTYRVREGATLGNLTVSSIERQQVTIELVEFGIMESRIMLLPRGTSGQGGPK
jgi:hypothetical protein